MTGHPSDMNPALETKGFSFSGTASEYFGIWIVNLLLSIVTLGIYTAWAKVRRLRYFYGNTWLDGHNLEYHAKPKQILIGRIIVFGVLVIVNIVSTVYPFFAVLVLVPYLIVLPWLLNKAIAFNARMTSYRNVHFGFEGSYVSALMIFVIVPFIIPAIGAALIFGGYYMGFVSEGDTRGAVLYVVPLFILAQLAIVPYLSKLTNEYIGNRTRYGAAKFAAQIGLRDLFKNFGITVLCAGAPLVLILGAIFSLYYSSSYLIFVFGFVQLMGLIFFAILTGMGIFYAAGVRNITFNATTLDGVHKLNSNLSRLKYVTIIITNFFAIILSIGLLRPWAAVRTWRYLADHTALQVAGSMDGFISGQEQAGSVIAGEYLDIEGIDFGL